MRKTKHPAAHVFTKHQRPESETTSQVVISTEPGIRDFSFNRAVGWELMTNYWTVVTCISIMNVWVWMEFKKNLFAGLMFIPESKLFLSYSLS